MPFTRPTLNDLILRIENDIISRLTGSIPLLQKALLKILARVLAGVADGTYGHQEFISIQMIIDKAEGEFLRRWAFQWQINIQEATFADGQARFTGTDSTLIPINTLLVRPDGIEYITTANGTIGSVTTGVVDIPVQATTAGLDGNAPGGTILTLSSPIIGVDDDVTLVGDGAEGGVDGDSDETIRQNLLNRIKDPPMGGSENDYKTVAEGVAGVAKAFPFENRAGTAQVLGSVTVVIKGVSPIVPGAGILDDVYTVISSPDFKPLTANVGSPSPGFVTPITSREVDFEISIKPDNQEVRDNITKNLEDTFNADAIPGETILISHIRNAISTAGVDDFVIDDIIVEGQGSVPVDQNINFTDFEYPFVETITFNVLS